MKYLQGKFFTGYVHIYIEGPHLESLLEVLARDNIHIWDVQRLGENTLHLSLRQYDLPHIYELVENSPYRIRVKETYGLPRGISLLKKRLDLVLSVCLAFIFLICLSQFIWSIEIDGLSEEVEVKVRSHLKENQIRPGSFKPFLANLSDMQEAILQNVPELLWIGVRESGTRLHFSGVEKIIQEEREEKAPQHLVANKKGVIDKMHISKGVPLVFPHDYVKKGERLVSGDLSVAFDEAKEEAGPFVAAEGEVYAKTWYEVQVSVPLTTKLEQLEDEKTDKYFLRIGKKRFLIWGFKQVNYVRFLVEEEEYPFKLFDYSFPIGLIKQGIYRTDLHEYERSKEEAISAGISEAKRSLQLNLGEKATVLSHKVLHESAESGKVKLNLLFTVSENIVEEIPITQGD